MTSLVDCLDYTAQKGKATKNGQSSPPPLFFVEGDPTLKEGTLPPKTKLKSWKDRVV
jgi:hypothetical protein